MEIRVFISFFFPFSALKSPTVAKAMLVNFALGKKKIKFPKFTNFHSLGVYQALIALDTKAKALLESDNFKAAL